MRRLSSALTITLLTCALTVTPVFATPAVNDLQSEKASKEGSIQSLQQELMSTLERISTLESDVAKKHTEIEDVTHKLEEADREEQKQLEAMKLRIQYMYEEGDSSFWEVIITAESFSDLVNKAEYVQNVHSYDREKLNEYIDAKQEVETLKINLDDELNNLKTTQSNLESEKTALNSTISTRQTEIAQLDQEIQESLAAAAAEEEARQAAIQQQQQANNNAPVNTPQGGAGNGAPPSTGSGNSGYAPPQGSDGSAVVAYARQFLGNPYVWAGTSLTNGADCSGFTFSVYKAFGVNLPRSSYGQETAGVGISLAEARAGDLIVYSGHVGIYNGSGGLVHASSPSEGIIESPSCTYAPIIAVRRVL